MTDKHKEARLAAALRENLRKRKAGTRSVESAKDATPDEEGKAG